MRISFAGDSLAFGLTDAGDLSSGPSASATRLRFSLDPKWVDLTPDYDPSARASELDIVQDNGLDLARYSVILDWRSGGHSEANQNYSMLLRSFGMPKVDVEECGTVFVVMADSLYVTCFLENAEYAEMLRLCENFASWPNQKYFRGRQKMLLLCDGLLAALNEDVFVSFWSGKLPLYSRKIVPLSFVQNADLPKPPSDRDKSTYHLSQV